MLKEQSIPVERLAPDEGARLFPSFDGQGLDSILFEPEAGVLRARDATRVIAEQAIERGARFVSGTAAPEGDAVLVNGERLEGDRVVWAGGAWLARLFPGLVPLQVTRQDVYFFGAPAGWQAPSVPGWVDFEGGVYGLGELDGRGFKASPDTVGPEFDPDSEDRVASKEKEQRAREYLAERFPALARSAARGDALVPLLADARHELPHRPAPRARPRVAHGRRLGPRVQARAGARRVRARACWRRRRSRILRSPSESALQGAACAPPGSSSNAYLTVKVPFMP